ncbi:hypothetical protein [Luteolibacter soli]|uniref:Uncharacterized protein n=1 Tax=Luteolibacter soli TaxID=3135280 RepID=A0ABU9B0K3_9BACT
MKLVLPRPRRIAQKLPLHEALALDCLRGFTNESGLGTAPPVDLLTNHLEITPEHAVKLCGSLQGRRLILFSNKEFAILSQLSAAIKKERDRNRRRSVRTACAPRSAMKPDWSLTIESQRRFPALRGPVERPASYNRPAAFEALLKEHPHHHRNDCPSNVEILTDACYPGELQTVLTLIEEQRSANRQPVLLFTRKAVYVGVLRHAKR